MRKKYYLSVLALLAVVGVVILGLQWYAGAFRGLTPAEEMYRARMKMQYDHLSDRVKLQPLPERRVVRLAIGGLGLPDDNHNDQLADLVTTELSNTKGLELVERQSLNKVLQELQMSLSGLIRARDAVRVGKLVRADWFLLGTRAAIAGTNSLVLRVVDARTGILRDAGIAIVSQAPVTLASSVATFVRQSRKNASSGRQSIYLAIGSFEDLSINSRRASFPSELRGYLIGAFQSGPVTLLEREYVETLLQEVYLDLAGLTEESATEPLAGLQSAFWLVTGGYQSYETTNLQVEVDLEVAPMFGRTKNVRLVGESGEPLNRKIKTAIEQAVNNPEASIVPTHRSEARLLMEHGQKLSGIENSFGAPDLVYLGEAFNTELDEQSAVRKRRNAQEALRMFQTVLLLEPTNQQAKLYIAACLRNNTIQRMEEARQYYREIIERPLNDKWSETARQALAASFDWQDAKGKALWFEAAAAQTGSPSAAEFYRREAEAAKTEALLKGSGSEAQAVAETRLLANITNSLLGGNVAGPVGTEEFLNSFGTNRGAAALRLAELYPKLRSQAPQFAPYLLAAVVSAQVDTNSPLVLEFQQLLEEFTQHPDPALRSNDFWRQVQLAILDWSWRHQDYRLASKLLEAKIAGSAASMPAAGKPKGGFAIEITDEDKMSLAFAYLGTHEWNKALPIFHSFDGQSLSPMSTPGPWGRPRTVLFPDRLADYCRKQMGQSVTSKKGEFQMGKPVLQLCREQVFSLDAGGLWTGRGDQLLYLDFEMNTNLALNLPLKNGAPITAICPSETNVWIGTDGDGLLEFDKVGRQFHHLREEDGLLMDKIASLHLSRDELWVGYGRRVREIEMKSDGGLGKIDLRTWKSVSFVPPLPKDLNLPRGFLPHAPAMDTPTRTSVLAITEGVPGDIWFLAEGPTPRLCRYRSGEKAWDMAIHQGCSCLDRDSERLLVGRYWNDFGQERTGALGLIMLDLTSTNSAWRDLKRPDGITPGCVTALTTEGRNLWVGGFGYIASIDLGSEELEAMAHVQAERVDRLQTGGGFLWAQFNCCLYRVSLASLP